MIRNPVNNFRRHTSFMLCAIVLLALTLLFFNKLAFSGLILGRGDVYSYFYPYWTVRSAAFQAGHFPMWSPDIFMGVPLLANSQIGTFYPLNWLVTPFSTPDAITISLIAHVFWAMLGVYSLTRRTLQLDAIPALLAGVLFGVGGYLSGQVEHINQLQALSWMPWLFLLFHENHKAGTRYMVSLQNIALLAGALALQLLAGHPQTVFITLVGLGIYALTVGIAPLIRRDVEDRFLLARLLLILIIAGVMALILASPQLIPTLELARQSNRSGGLNPQQAMAFSFNPYLIGRGLLPSYDGLLFGEYMAYSGVIGLGLAVIGAISRQPSVVSANNGFKPIVVTEENSALSTQHSALLPWIVLVIVGFLLALGVYNPLYWGLASLPGFSFFRVPARWLALVALAVSALAGMGLQTLKTTRPRWWVYGVMIGLIGGLGAASFLADRMAVDVTGSALPTTRTLMAWGAAGIVLLVGTFFARGKWTRYSVSLLAIAGTAELFFASQILPYNELVPPDTYTASRFTIRQLQAYADEQTPPGRVLSITPLQFDPGDVDALKNRYAGLGMSDLAVRIALVDTKLREVLGPNLPLEWGIPSIDGFDGGLLPTDFYTQFTSLMLPPGQDATVDGRLGEMMALPDCRGACIPDQRWLSLTNTQYLITDKVGDFWQNGAAYDTQFEVTIQPGTVYTPENVPQDFVANAVDVLYKGDSALRWGDLSAEPLTLDAAAVPGLDGYQLARFRLDAPQDAIQLRLTSDSTAQIRAITLVDTRVSEVFQQLMIGTWGRVLSSDIKLYANQTVQPRAFVVSNIQTVSNDAAALDAMRNSDFNPSESAIVSGGDSLATFKAGSATAQIVSYTAERIEIQVHAESEGLLVLTDAYYPGWVATVNGEPATIYRTDIMFRGVKVPAGESTVIFEYRPGWWPGILVAGGAAWLTLLAALVIGRAKKGTGLLRNVT